jgi:hypothetical protein
MQFPPTITVGELVTRSRDAVIVDASRLYSPFNKADIDVRVRYSQAHIPASWFLDLRSLARAYPPADGRVDALTRPPRAAVFLPTAVLFSRLPCLLNGEGSQRRVRAVRGGVLSLADLVSATGATLRCLVLRINHRPSVLDGESWLEWLPHTENTSLLGRVQRQSLRTVSSGLARDLRTTRNVLIPRRPGPHPEGSRMRGKRLENRLLSARSRRSAMATVGVSFAVTAAPICLLAARNFAPPPWLYYPRAMVPKHAVSTRSYSHLRAMFAEAFNVIGRVEGTLALAPELRPVLALTAHAP